jgi:cation/acetate symporter
MLINAPSVRAALGLSGQGLWFGIQPISAGVFGVAAGLVTTVLVSLAVRPAASSSQD